MDPNFAEAHDCLADSYEHKAMYKEAIEEHQRAIALSKGNLVASFAGHLRPTWKAKFTWEKLLVKDGFSRG